MKAKAGHPKNPLAAPFVKWAGGKRQLLPALKELLPPKKRKAYCEPFAGGAALLFELQPHNAHINDINNDLINTYQVIRDDVQTLIKILQKHQNTPEYFYRMRDMDRNPKKYQKLSNTEKAARLIYLNKTCYNGLFRVNNAGEFNTPFGYYKNPNIVNAPTLLAISDYLNNNDIRFSSCDYKEILRGLNKDFFVYLDPPYDPVSGTANFTGYAKGGFDRKEQENLRQQCDILHQRGIAFMLSNSNTEFIRQQYANYSVTTVQARRYINSNVQGRGDVDELIIRNYE